MAGYSFSQIALATLKWTIAALLCIAVAGALYQYFAEAREMARFPAPGILVEVEGHVMHIHCVGEGSPTVIFEQGLGGVTASWEHLVREVGVRTRACGYDRAGLGYSEPVGRPTRAAQVALNLHALLSGAGIEDDLVLVGWSAGGMYAREFQRRFPERVRGMVLVESSHEQQLTRLPPGGGGRSPLVTVARYLAPLGIVRLSGLARAQIASSDTPEELKPRLVALYQRSHALAALMLESDGFDTDLLTGAAPTPLGDLPLVVITGAKPVAELEAYLEAKLVLQRELAALSSRSRHVMAEQSEHAIHGTEPALFVGAVLDVVDAVREGTTVPAAAP